MKEITFEVYELKELKEKVNDEAYHYGLKLLTEDYAENVYKLDKKDLIRSYDTYMKEFSGDMSEDEVYNKLKRDIKMLKNQGLTGFYGDEILARGIEELDLKELVKDVMIVHKIYKHSLEVLKTDMDNFVNSDEEMTSYAIENDLGFLKNGHLIPTKAIYFE